MLEDKLRKLRVWTKFKENTISYNSKRHLSQGISENWDIGCFFLFDETKQGLQFWMKVAEEVGEMR